MIKKHSKDHNNGVALCFIKILETRMGRNVIAILCMTRLRDTLSATMLSSEFHKLKMWREFCASVQRMSCGNVSSLPVECSTL